MNLYVLVGQWAQVRRVLDLLQTHILVKVVECELKQVFQVRIVLVCVKVILTWLVDE